MVCTLCTQFTLCTSRCIFAYKAAHWRYAKSADKKFPSVPDPRSQFAQQKKEGKNIGGKRRRRVISIQAETLLKRMEKVLIFLYIKMSLQEKYVENYHLNMNSTERFFYYLRHNKYISLHSFEVIIVLLLKEVLSLSNLIYVIFLDVL